jgi:AcrR family transcriptional regulator
MATRLERQRTSATPARPRGRPVAKPQDRRWTRLSPADRQEMILTEAVRFFAEHGFEALTRDLAKRIGVSQALIYRYFSTKEELIDQVYQRLYMSRWDPYWEVLLADRSMPLAVRLQEFYKRYVSTFDNYVWMRISVYSGLRGNNLVQRYLKIIHDRVIQVVMRELRHECGLPPLAPSRVPKLDLELVWNLHGTFIYLLMRRYVFQIGPPADNDALAQQAVEQVLVGTLHSMRERYSISAETCSEPGLVKCPG